MPIAVLQSPPFDVIRCDDPRLRVACPAVAALGSATLAEMALSVDPGRGAGVGRRCGVSVLVGAAHGGGAVGRFGYRVAAGVDQHHWAATLVPGCQALPARGLGACARRAEEQLDQRQGGDTHPATPRGAPADRVAPANRCSGQLRAVIEPFGQGNVSHSRALVACRYCGVVWLASLASRARWLAASSTPAPRRLRPSTHEARSRRHQERDLPNRR